MSPDNGRRALRDVQRQGRNQDCGHREPRLRHGLCTGHKAHAGVVLCRKPGKLPGETVQESYSKEYGTDTIEIHKDAITEDDIVLLHDDLLATGGTMKAAYDLVKKFNPKKVYVNFLIELIHEDLNGRSNFEEGTDITSLLQV